MVDYIVSVDLGQSMDHSALAVLRRCWWRPGQNPDPDTAKLWHEVPELIQWPLDTPYPQIIQEVEATYRAVDDGLSQWGTRLVVDQSGPGRPVLDALRVKVREANKHAPTRLMRPIGVTITGGESVNVRDDGTLTCPKRDIASALVVEVQAGAFKVAAALPHAATLRDELATFGYKVNRRTQHLGYESLDAAVHDDLVLAAALGLWYSTQQLSTRFPSAIAGGATIEDMDYNPLARGRV